MKLNSWVILYASLIHIIWAALLLVSSSPLLSTPISGFHFGFWGDIKDSVAILFIATALLATYGIKHRNLLGALSLIPQQTVLFISALAGISAAIKGQYADGTVRSGIFILADQLPSILLCFIYTLGILDKYRSGFAKRN